MCSFLNRSLACETAADVSVLQAASYCRPPALTQHPNRLKTRACFFGAHICKAEFGTVRHQGDNVPLWAPLLQQLAGQLQNAFPSCSWRWALHGDSSDRLLPVTGGFTLQSGGTF